MIPFCPSFTVTLTFLKLIIFLAHEKLLVGPSQLANRDQLVAARAIETVSCNSDNLDECNPGADNAAGSQFFETSSFGIARLFETLFFSLKVMRTHHRFLKI